jgi:hypothetical protein
MQMTTSKPKSINWIAGALCCVSLCIAGLACSGGTTTADNGGMSGTGISQGSIASFGSIFVNGVEWKTGSAQIEIDGVMSVETDLRVGMVVRVHGDLDASGLSGTATSVNYDNDVEGPIEDDPVLVVPGGTEKSFTVLGRTIIAGEFDTIFDEGASFALIARDDVVEVSGFVDNVGNVRAERIELIGQFPDVDGVELEGVVANLVKNDDGTGLFGIGSVTIDYSQATIFSGFVEADLIEGDVVEVKGTLIGGGTNRIDAAEIEHAEDDLSGEDADVLELEGIVSEFVSIAEFDVADFPVDASGATFDPMGTMITDGDRVEIKGSLVAGVVVAERVEFEDESLETVKIRAAISAIDGVARTATLLGVEVLIDANTQLEDERDGLSNFGFEHLMVGDWLSLEAISTGSGTARATRIERRNAEADVVLEGPITALDRMAPALSVMDQSIPIDVMTAYFDDLEQSRTAEEFFENPGDVEPDDVVKVTDVGALQSDALLEADIVEIED